MSKIRTQPNISKRASATLIDFMIYFPIWIGYIYYFGEPDKEGGYSVSGTMSLPLILIWFLYFPVMEAFKGQTIGHIIVGLKVVTFTGGSISIGQAFKRRLLDIIDLFPFFGLVAYITVKNTDRNQRVGDIWAKAIVVGGETRTCRNCHTELTLTPEESISNSFECPECGKKNEN